MKTTLLDIYEAAGAEVNEDRTAVKMTGAPLKPFDIVLRVVPSVVEYDGIDGTYVTFNTQLDPRLRAEGTLFQYVYDDVSIRLPVEQVHILKENS